jgi:hypothetical protein
MTMKTDDTSGEAAKPPGENSGNTDEKIPDSVETYDELQWARRHDPGDPLNQPKIRKTKKGAKKQRLVFRKTELRDRPPGARADRRPPAPPRWTRVAEELDVRIAALDERADAIEFRLEQEIKRLENRLRAPGHREGS